MVNLLKSRTESGSASISYVCTAHDVPLADQQQSSPPEILSWLLKHVAHHLYRSQAMSYQCAKGMHRLQHGLLVQIRLVRIHCRQQPEVVDVVRGVERVNEPRLLLARVRERMRRSDGHNDAVARLCVNRAVRAAEPHRARRHHEDLVVHLVPVRRVAGRVGRHDDSATPMR